jgi:hypothetical protein
MKRLILILAGLIVSTVATAKDTYFTATGQEDGKPLVFRGILAVPESIRKDQLPNRMTIFWHYVPVGDGMPSAETNEAQIELEDALLDLDVNELGRQVLVVTGNGRKEWHWYVKDPDNWSTQLRQRVAGHSYPIIIERANDPHWSLYLDFLSGLKGL